MRPPAHRLHSRTPSTPTGRTGMSRPRRGFYAADGDTSAARHGHTENKCAADEDASAGRAGCHREDAVTRAPGRPRVALRGTLYWFTTRDRKTCHVTPQTTTASPSPPRPRRPPRGLARPPGADRDSDRPIGIRDSDRPIGIRDSDRPSGFGTWIGSLRGIGTQIGHSEQLRELAF